VSLEAFTAWKRFRCRAEAFQVCLAGHESFRLHCTYAHSLLSGSL
jgi:hypothetical protein